MAVRGEDRGTGQLFSYVSLESRVPADHPLRAIRDLVNAALAGLSGDFDALYSRIGRPGIAPERLLRALLLQCFYSVRSERQLMERLEFDLLFRWFVGLEIDEPVWDASVFSKNRDRLLAGEVAQRFLAELVGLPEVERLLSAEHFSVDGTLIQAWASLKSFRAKDGTGEERRAQLQGREALERDPCQHHRPGRAPLPQGRRRAGAALLYRARADGES
jgi:transposase